MPGIKVGQGLPARMKRASADIQICKGVMSMLKAITEAAETSLHFPLVAVAESEELGYLHGHVIVHVLWFFQYFCLLVREYAL